MLLLILKLAIFLFYFNINLNCFIIKNNQLDLEVTFFKHFKLDTTVMYIQLSIIADSRAFLFAIKILLDRNLN